MAVSKVLTTVIRIDQGLICQQLIGAKFLVIGAKFLRQRFNSLAIRNHHRIEESNS